MSHNTDPFLPVAWVPKVQSAWMNRISGWVINILIKVGQYYRRYNNIEEKHVSLFLNNLIIHELPFNLIIKRSGHPVQEAIATMTAYAMGIPVPRIICYTEKDPKFGGDEELFAIIDEVGDCLHKIRRFSSPYGDAVCGPDGQHIYTRAMPDLNWRRCESPEDYHDDMLSSLRRRRLQDNYPEHYARVLKLKERSYTTVFGHGDLHLGNIMAQNGRLTGIIDWEGGGWYPEYWDFVLPMPLWPREWDWVVDLLYSISGGDKSEQERDAYHALIELIGHYYR
ncbi:hypothetical protein NP233_g6939 [Leucocoprinus birnbaumii]|uniref:Aminoglycoside phosphotransferase domain-containing protein n=1 Tax=Leucocoprinus birnbaumii TaxID=56174 RepID=A0AAD5VSW3_9AGAR|nr:hypothetical protein NP233_g6939 [Leucocoprinus birnbaumii]